MALYDDIYAQANNSGMTQEEWQRRDQLVRAVMQHNPELAAEIARGPYRANGGSGAGAPPQGASGPPGDPGYLTPPLEAPRGRSADLMQSPTIAPVMAPAGAGGVQRPAVAQRPPEVPIGPPNAQGNYGGPPQPTGNPRYDFPNYQSGGSLPSQQPTVSINIGGVGSSDANRGAYDYNAPPAGTSAPFGTVPFDPMGAAQGYAGAAFGGIPQFGPPAPRMPSGNANERAVFAGNALSAMSNPNYPYSPNYPMPQRPVYTPPPSFMPPTMGNFSR